MRLRTLPRTFREFRTGNISGIRNIRTEKRISVKLRVCPCSVKKREFRVETASVSSVQETFVGFVILVQKKGHP